MKSASIFLSYGRDRCSCKRNAPGNYMKSSVFMLLVLLVSDFGLGRFTAEGAAMSKLIEPIQNGVEEKTWMVRNQMIGSRPPRCDKECSNCEHCEAIQVPITTHAHSTEYKIQFSTIEYSRGDDISNYKPMSWKCKCGNLLLNP